MHIIKLSQILFAIVEFKKKKKTKNYLQKPICEKLH